MPAPETRFKFTDAQCDCINSYIPAFKEQVLKHDPLFNGRSTAITLWKKDTAKDLLKEGVFENLDPVAGSRKEWREASCLLF